MREAGDAITTDAVRPADARVIPSWPALSDTSDFTVEPIAGGDPKRVSVAASLRSP
jgi:hypothetical protein